MLKKFSLVLAFLLFIPTVSYGAECSAASAIVIDGLTNEILYEKNAYEERSMASTTKIMTSLIACESGKLDDVVSVTDEMVNVIGTSLGLRAGDKITLYDLVVGMLIVSGNDAANAAAIYLGGSIEGFAKMMNEKAESIGMKNSLFVTPSGLDEGKHHSTAYDMAVLASNAIKNEIFAQICKEKRMEVTINGEKHSVYNHNKLLSYLDDCIGIKTGYTEKAGRCLVSAVNRNGKIMICVTMNDGNDWNDHVSLFKACDKKYQKKEIKDVVNINVVGGNKDKVSASYSAEVNVLNPEYVTVECYYFPFVYAPVEQGEEIGKIIVKYKEKEVTSAPITAEESVEYYAKQE
ncbi:MAG: D-alanyl-D-alanine carboxypeptidase [Eubacterium sp.]|nr:D-alanyl-D-alanine carboxypeptidase [Eubacterium sp.]